MQPRHPSTALSPLLCSIALILGSCGGSAAPEPAAGSSGSEATSVTAPVPPPSAAEADLTSRMHASFELATQARDALIAGELAPAQRAAETLAKEDFAAHAPADWKHWLALSQQHALELSMAPNLASAAQELGSLAVVCGECHDLQRRGPHAVRTEPEPWRDPPEQFDERMLRHQLGAEQIWVGLILRSEGAYRSGTITLTRAPLGPPLREGEAIDPGLHARVEEVRALAKQARAARTHEERGRVYGELIARCATCHTYNRPAAEGSLE